MKVLKFIRGFLVLPALFGGTGLFIYLAGLYPIETAVTILVLASISMGFAALEDA